MQTAKELDIFLQAALSDDARNKVVATGDAWSMMRRQGVPIEDSPTFRQTLDSDLAEYGFSILDGALELREIDLNSQIALEAFAHAGRVFEALIRNGDPSDPRRGFYRVVSAASYHLGGYAAVAYSLLSRIEIASLNINVSEECLIRLLLRDMKGIQKIARSWVQSVVGTDTQMANMIDNLEAEREEAISNSLTTSICKSIAIYEFALITGNDSYTEQADTILHKAYDIAGVTGFVSFWWIIRITRLLLRELWRQTLHQVLPSSLPGNYQNNYRVLRDLFIASRFSQKVSQIELWPSQIEAARRSIESDDDLVVALPTSAGKTRVAELATLTTLAQSKRALIVTPLRALSAQTERSFRSTFSPLGASVSSLYGKSGLSAGDSNALSSDDIVVSTPEKLDFALRNNPDIIDDIGLIVLDEGHMIGPSEREINYEILVQKLLKRKDADERRLVCLSAILPQGDTLDDITHWIRSDVEGEAVRSEWRPTRQRFGIIDWRGNSGTLRYDLEDDGPFYTRFVEEHPAIPPERNPRPRDLKDVTLMSAWKFAAEGKRTLIFVTQANWVEGFGKQAINLVNRGYLEPITPDPEAIRDSISIGEEWLGPEHPAVQALKIGIAIHHGRLPSPFLREIERLLASGQIMVTAASPTLSQGLNLNAAVLLAPYLVRAGNPISAEEFANVAGRAGRAFVDTEGLILHVITDRHIERKNSWKRLVTGVKERSLTSGLLTVIQHTLEKLNQNGLIDDDDGFEYLANNREAWTAKDNDDDEPLDILVSRLDSIVFGLVEALDTDDKNLPHLLEEAMQGSLWSRQIDRLKPNLRPYHLNLLTSRARLIWHTTNPEQRKGHFAMGVGLESGLKIDDCADALHDEMDRADIAALQGDAVQLHTSLVTLAEILLTIKPFEPDNSGILNGNWKQVLSRWIQGDTIADIGANHVDLIEDVFIYRLVWAIEAVRTRRVSTGWEPADGVIPGAAAACLDTGLPDYRMSLLVRSGLPSRNAAISVIKELNPMVFDPADLKDWIGSDEIFQLSLNEEWPTEATSNIWNRFRDEILTGTESPWSKTTLVGTIENTPESITTGDPCRIEVDELLGEIVALSPSYEFIGRIDTQAALDTDAVLYGKFESDQGDLLIHRTGKEA